ncbi:MAG: thioredoxin family protein [Marinifilaceae bacterium]|jgi:alkyl hydroperoxide reductase subunit F|nr:thioredoxin family protein [Marinifilaceae bacterium]
MLEAEVKSQVKTIFKNLKNNYVFRVEINENHSSKKELVELLTDFVQCSDNLSLDIQNGESMSFKIESSHRDNGIVFKAVPNGHEFTSLLLAVLNMDGQGKNIPSEKIQESIKAIDFDICLKSYISLSCTNCPEVVQALNLISIINPNIRHEIIDGSMHLDEVKRLNIESAPAVFLNGSLLHMGRSNLTILLEKINKKVKEMKVAESVI